MRDGDIPPAIDDEALSGPLPTILGRTSAESQYRALLRTARDLLVSSWSFPSR